MMWQSLYIHTADSKEIAEAVQAVLETHGYNAYDPFPGGSGTPTGLKKMARHFVAPAVNRWVRVLGEPVEELLSETSRAIGKPMLYGWLDEETSGFALYRNGKRDDDLDALRPYVRTTFEELQRAAAGEMRMDEIVSKEPPVVILGADALPPEIQQLADEHGVDSKHANKMAERIGGKLFGRLAKQAGESKSDQEQARDVLMGGGRDVWNSLEGQKVRAMASALKLPEHWRTPTWEEVRDAYQVFRLRERSPRMMLMPGDKEAMKAVPDALDYIPVYMGLK
ncbi:MAG TPA: hypothetical protein VHP83_26950 [Aggregatilineaceae bacterium]|nr:hypothetical protein [Aggregatilineaceae bacterium]